MYVEGSPIDYNDPTGHYPKIGNNLETSDKEEGGREQDVEFNWNIFNLQQPIMGTEDDEGGMRNWEYWLSEESIILQALDYYFFHPTAVVHDHWLTEYQGWWEENFPCEGGGLFFNIVTMIPAFIVGTYIAETNLILWAGYSV
jgi:hypothetical protein